MNKMLVIDDDVETCETMESLIVRQLHSCDTAQTLEAGRTLLASGNYDIVLLDVCLPDGNGLDMLPEIMALNDAPEVIILTGKGDPDGAKLAIEGGAWDYILKPSSVRHITLTLNRALKYLQQKNARNTEPSLDLSAVIGISQDIKACLQTTAKAARQDANVLITGETGTGKELFARTIHKNSSRTKQNFVVVDCATLTETLIESTLFGHRKGAFTGAQTDQQGLVKMADGGTLFLDEIGEMPLSLQKVFLRVLQERRFRPVGAPREETSNFRLIAATNKDIKKMVEQGSFRSDLFFRINTMHMQLPPLRKRTEDIEPLLVSQMQHLKKRYNMTPKKLGDDFLATLTSYHWPGNVRELFNTLEQAMINADEDDTLYNVHLASQLRIQVTKAQIEQHSETTETNYGNGAANSSDCEKNQPTTTSLFTHPLPPLKEFKSQAEKAYLSELIKEYNKDLNKILAQSGLSRSHFYALIKKYEIYL